MVEKWLACVYESVSNAKPLPYETPEAPKSLNPKPQTPNPKP